MMHRYHPGLDTPACVSIPRVLRQTRPFIQPALWLGAVCALAGSIGIEPAINPGATVRCAWAADDHWTQQNRGTVRQRRPLLERELPGFARS